jgi:serine/threonine protein kinase
MDDPLLGQQLANYRLLQALGQGSFAQVYLGQHVHLDIYAAVKVLHAQLGVQEEQEFRKEALLLARLKNLHIIRILDYGVTNNRPFLIMELAANGSLNKIYPHGTRLPLLEIVAYVMQIADGLGYAHEQNVVHRDIKPENILVGDSGELLLADFGIAKLLTSSSNMTNTLAGTLAYMAPEQFMGRPGPASDQYALGIMVYEWLAGRFPFQGTVAEVTGQHLKSPPPLLRQFNPAISPEVEGVALTALKKEPVQRFRNVQAFANALRQAARVDDQQIASVKVNTSGPNQQKRGNAVKSEPKVVRQTDPGSSQPLVDPQPLNPQPVNPPPVYIQSKPPLPFTTLPALPQAQLTDFWWPTFIVSAEQRRTINQGTIPSEQLGTLGSLPGFPSQPIALPTSTTANPLSTGSLKNITRISSTPPVTNVPLVDNKTPPLTRPRPAPGLKAPPPPVRRTPGPGGSPPLNVPPRPATSPYDGVTNAWATVAIIALFIGIICTISGSSSYSETAMGWSWVLIVVSTFTNIVALLRARQRPTLRGWLIFFLGVAILMLIINIPVQIHTNSYAP